MYKLIGSVNSRALRVLWMLEEIGAPYEHIPAKPRDAAVKGHYAVGKIPVLLAAGTALTDSVAIMTYLADKHGAFTHPAGSVERAIQDGHTCFLNDEFDSVLWTAARHSFVLPEEQRVPAVKDSLRWEYERSLSRLEERLGEGPYLMGEAPTIPDFLATHCSRWARNAKFPEPSPRLQAYFDAMQSRPAYRAALKVGASG